MIGTVCDSQETLLNRADDASPRAPIGVAAAATRREEMERDWRRVVRSMASRMEGVGDGVCPSRDRLHARPAPQAGLLGGPRHDRSEVPKAKALCNFSHALEGQLGRTVERTKRRPTLPPW